MQSKGYDLFGKAADNIIKDLRFKEWKVIIYWNPKKENLIIIRHQMIKKL